MFVPSFLAWENHQVRMPSHRSHRNPEGRWDVTSFSNMVIMRISWTFVFNSVRRFFKGDFGGARGFVWNECIQSTRRLPHSDLPPYWTSFLGKLWWGYFQKALPNLMSPRQIPVILVWTWKIVSGEEYVQQICICQLVVPLVYDWHYQAHVQVDNELLRFSFPSLPVRMHPGHWLGGVNFWAQCSSSVDPYLYDSFQGMLVWRCEQETVL